MFSSFSPKAKRNIARIIPFAIIWVVMGWIILYLEHVASINGVVDDETAIHLNFPVVLFATVSVALIGLLVGVMEVIWLEKVFRKRSFAQKLFYKFGLYALTMLVIISIAYPIAASIELNTSLFSQAVQEKFFGFMLSPVFWSTMVGMGTSLFLCLFYAGISENLGHKVMLNFFTGKYHSPKEEERIFMFLDLKASTTIAEKLGHVRYFNFLQEYYDNLSDAIIAHQGEVYQYIGDEIVVSWRNELGLKSNNCVECFFAMKRDLQKRWPFYETQYGFEPSFKAAIHFGRVTTGEIGALKKEIFYTGDVLNTTARIQGLCNEYGEELLISEALQAQLSLDAKYQTKSHGKAVLKGKASSLEIVGVRKS
ncbi:adenylate/guanylate cyclase domain-containing protein [Roseivirga pacifica]|uniref:adenylate/guanylate cyclase domain-containing protein n=1 Tax=Roseivirga pacifica TaxID=1267423 RepID=UPI003BAC7321